MHSVGKMPYTTHWVRRQASSTKSFWISTGCRHGLFNRWKRIFSFICAVALTVAYTNKVSFVNVHVVHQSRPRPCMRISDMTEPFSGKFCLCLLIFLLQFFDVFRLRLSILRTPVSYASVLNSAITICPLSVFFLFFLICDATWLLLLKFSLLDNALARASSWAVSYIFWTCFIKSLQVYIFEWLKTLRQQFHNFRFVLGQMFVWLEDRSLTEFTSDSINSKRSFHSFLMRRRRRRRAEIEKDLEAILWTCNLRTFSSFTFKTSIDNCTNVMEGHIRSRVRILDLVFGSKIARIFWSRQRSERRPTVH